MSGAPRRSYQDQNFVVVRMEAVDELGDYNIAGVWQRIAWRAETTGGWKVTYGDIAKEVHLTAKQVRRAVDVLRDKGWITAGRADRFDPTLTFQVVWEDQQETAPAAQTGGRDDMRVTSSGDLGGTSRGALEVISTFPSGDRETEVETYTIPAAENGNGRETDHPDSFAEFWGLYPRKVSKPAALKAWVKATKKTPPEIILAGERRLMVEDPNRPELQFIPHPATWLNAGRWEDGPYPPPPGDRRMATTDQRAAQTADVIASLRARKQQQIEA